MIPRRVELNRGDRPEGLHCRGNQPVDSAMKRIASVLVVAVIKFITHFFLHHSGGEIERAAVGLCGLPAVEQLEFVRGEPRNAGTFGKNGGTVFDELRQFYAIHHTGLLLCVGAGGSGWGEGPPALGYYLVVEDPRAQ